MPLAENKSLFLASLAVLAICLAALVTGAHAGEKSIATIYSTVYYSGDGQLAEFARKTAKGAGLARDSAAAEALARENVDRIVFRVKTLLDMYPRDFNFKVRLYDSHKGLKEVFREKGIMGSPPVAFYSHRSQTIYLSLDRLSDGIFAHEVAHAVINAYFPAPPPAQMQEILAQYVDKHLWDDEE